MKIQERVLLAPFTTFHIGGSARVFIEAYAEKEIEEAIQEAHARNLPLLVLGAGSNVLVPDEGVEGVVMKIMARGIIFQKEGDDELLIADSGTPWGEVVDAANARGLFGIENLAGIPGTVGGAAVQNIGAYGAEIANVFEYADSIDSTNGTHRRIDRAEAEFRYRSSSFKKNRANIITRVALRLSKKGMPNLSYPDLARKRDSGAPLATPADISRAVCAIRADKFPCSSDEGTAGSFFKNPCVSRELADSLTKRFSGLPVFPQENGLVKIPLAWILDRKLSLKGYEKGRIRLYEKQPLVIVARAGATAAEVNAFARAITENVFNETGIKIEREVETFGA